MQIGSVGGFGPPSQAMRDKMFARVDRNGDQTLSIEEFKSGMPKGAPLSGTGGASSGEELFKRLDTDGDGALTQDEMDTGMKGVAEEMQTAIAQHTQGDSSSLVGMLFRDSTDKSTSIDDRVADASADSLQRRQMQWLLDAFVSQNNVNSALSAA